MIKIDQKTEILVISSDLEIASVCKMILTRAGLKNITTLESGVEALKACEKKRFDAILCDKSTKHLSGWLFIQEFKNSPNHFNSAIIYFGSNPCDQSPAALAEYGVLGYAPTPFNPQVLMSLVSSTLIDIQQSYTLEYRFKTAKEALVLKNGALAEERYSALSADTKQNVRSSLGVFHSYELQGKTTNATEIAHKLEIMGTRSPAAVMAIIRSMCVNQKFEEAIARAKELVEDTKNTALYFAACIETFNKYGKFELSELIASKAQEAGFGANVFSLAIARGRFSAGDIEDAIKIIESAEKDFGPSLEGLNLLGVCLRHLNKFEESRSCYERALKISPMDSKIYFNLAISETFLNRKDLAIKHLKTCLKIAPDYDKAMAKLVELEAEQNPDSQ